MTTTAEFGRTRVPAEHKVRPGSTLTVFHYDNGLIITEGGLALDVRRRQRNGYVSHAHTDHIAPHEVALCTAATGRLYQLRLGSRRVVELPYRQPVDWGNLRLTAYPAGHCLGSAMLLVERGDTSLLYTGDFKLARPLTCEPAELPAADVLIMECTFGSPRYRLPSRERISRQLIDVVREALANGKTPIIQAYALGKAQEITKILTKAGLMVYQDHEVYEISQIYEQFGVDLGEVRPYNWKLSNEEPLDLQSPRQDDLCDRAALGGVFVVSPKRAALVAQEVGNSTVSIAVTGWAVDPSTRYRLSVDHALPLSDHADYDELLQTVEQVGPRKVFCTHGRDLDGFVNRLCELGHDAYPLGRPGQRRLF